jgi:hypothetical protein
LLQPGDLFPEQFIFCAWISDTGIGIQESLLKDIFEPFTQSEGFHSPPPEALDPVWPSHPR